MAFALRWVSKLGFEFVTVWMFIFRMYSVAGHASWRTLDVAMYDSNYVYVHVVCVLRLISASPTHCNWRERGTGILMTLYVPSKEPRNEKWKPNKQLKILILINIALHQLQGQHRDGSQYNGRSGLNLQPEEFDDRCRRELKLIRAHGVQEHGSNNLP